ncbi:MAG: hypothetical protein QM675_01910 [Protaetiibacter sp.]
MSGSRSGSGVVRRFVTTALVASPLAIVVIASGFFTAGVVTAAAHVFLPWVTIPLGVVLAAGGLFLLGPVASSRREVVAVPLVIAFAVAWVLVQLPYATEYLRPSRDPGIYTITGIWLAQHGTPSIDVGGALRMIEGVPGLTGDLGPFSPEGDGQVRLQGGDGAPTIVALGYWVAGTSGALTANLVMGGIGVLAVYELARRLLRSSLLALLATVVLGLSVPFVYFSRAPYTEIAALAFFAAATALLVDAVRSGGQARMVLAGVLAGVASATRIDAYLALAMMLAALALAMALRFTHPSVRTIPAFLRFAVPGCGLAAIGVIDLLVNYGRYVNDLGTRFVLLVLLLVVVVLGCLVALTLVRRRAAEPAGLTIHGGRRWWVGMSAACVVLVAFWLSRPLWIEYHMTTGYPYQVQVSQLQAQAGLPLDPTRSYDEYSLWWVVWYFGLPMLVLMTAGIVLLLRSAFLGHDPGVWILIVPVLGVAALYIDLISISPDQPWAFRRLLPVVTPGLVIAGFATIDRVLSSRRRRWLSRVAAVAAVLVVALGLRISWSAPLMGEIHLSGVRAETEQLCDAVRGHDLVVADVSDNGAATLKMVCGVEVAGFTVDEPKARAGALSALVARGLDVVVVVESPDSVPWQGAVPGPTVVATIERWNSSLLGAPETIDTTTRSTWVAEVAPDGSLSPG